MRVAVAGALIFALAPTSAGAPAIGPADDPDAFVPVLDDGPGIVRRDVVVGTDGEDRRWVLAVRDLLESRFDVEALPSWAPLTLWTVDDELVAFEITTPEGGAAFATRVARERAGSFAERWVFADGTSLDGPVLARPLLYHSMTSKIGLREHPLRRRLRFHAGTDYAAPIGTPVRAVADGVVTRAERSWTAGNYIAIRHDAAGGLETKYMHLNRRAPGVVVGAWVRQGEIIGEVGKTGRVTGPHLHFEVRTRWRTPVDPAVASWPSATRVSDERTLADLRVRRELLLDWDNEGRRALVLPFDAPHLFVHAAPVREPDPRAFLPPLATVRPAATRARLTPPAARRRRRTVTTMKPLFDDALNDADGQVNDPLLHRAMQLATDFADDPRFA